MRKIAVITGTRAEYGLLYWIMKGIHEDHELELQLIVTGMHLSPEFGLTVREIEKDGFPIAERVEMLLSSDTEEAVAISMGVGIQGFAKAYSRLMPDLIVVLGDRFEIHAAVSAAVPFRIPVAHIHGGEVTEGAMDEMFRHAITKMSHIHFPAIETYAERVRQLGEHPDRVFCFGAPGIDNIYKLTLMDRQKLSEELQLPADGKWGIVGYHPATLEKNSAEVQIKEILNAVAEFPNLCWIFTLPNADMESRVIINNIKDYVSKKPKTSRLFSSLGQLRYLSLLRHGEVLVGNSSSGIIEASSFELPVVNIGSRQTGRIKPANVIDVPVCERDKIVSAVRRAMSGEFRHSLRGLKNPYGDGTASKRIVDVLKKFPLENILKKPFYESGDLNRG